MADAAPLSDPPAPGRRRVLWPGGLSARLLLLTLLVVVLANAIIVPVLLANRQREWLSDRVAAGELASFVVNAAPEGKVTQRLQQQVLSRAGLVAVNVQQADGVMRSVLAPARLSVTGRPENAACGTCQPSSMSWAASPRRASRSRERALRLNPRQKSGRLGARSITVVATAARRSSHASRSPAGPAPMISTSAALFTAAPRARAGCRR